MVQRIKGLGWRPDKPDYRDELFKPTAIRLPPSVFLETQFVPRVRDQGDQGSCTGHATANAVSYTRQKWDQPINLPSPRFIYWNGRVLESTTQEDSGCEIRDVIKGVHRYGVCPEDFCPYDPRRYTDEPSRAAFEEATKDILKIYRRIDAKLRIRALKEAVVRHQPVVFGFSVFEDFDTQTMMDTGELQMPTGAMVGGHAVWIVGYDNDHGKRGAFLIQNSWGTDWGTTGPSSERGYFWMPYDYIADDGLCDDFWALKSVT